MPTKVRAKAGTGRGLPGLRHRYLGWYVRRHGGDGGRCITLEIQSSGRTSLHALSMCLRIGQGTGTCRLLAPRQMTAGS
jgi:hypothetical protein